MPKSSSVSTSPAAKICDQRRLTATRAVKRIPAVDQPARQPQPVTAAPGRKGVQRRRARPAGPARRIEEIPLPQNPRDPPVGSRQLGHHRQRRDRRPATSRARRSRRAAASAPARSIRNAAQELGLRLGSLAGRHVEDLEYVFGNALPRGRFGGSQARFPLGLRGREPRRGGFQLFSQRGDSTVNRRTRPVMSSASARQ